MLPPLITSHNPASNIVHGAFLILLIITLGVGLWSRQAAVGFLTNQAEHTNIVLANRIYHQYAAGRGQTEDAVLLVRIYAPDAKQIFSSHPGAEGTSEQQPGLQQALAGTAASEYLSQPRAMQESAKLSQPVLQSFVPIWVQQRVAAVVEVQVKAATLQNNINQASQQLALAMFLVAASAIFALFFISRYIQLHSAHHEDTITHQNNHDDLTGVANRVLFWDRLKLAIAHAQRNEKLVTVMRINLNRFKQVNSGLGHAVADKLLQKVASRLCQAIRASDTVARMGGDDFAVILSEIDRKDEIETAVQRIIQPLHERYQIDGHQIDISTRVGIAVYPTDQIDEESLLFAADAALMEAKRDTSSDYTFFAPNMGKESASRLQQEQGLRQALENDEFCLYYQPKVNSTSGAIKGFEALIRWQHPEHGLVPPIQFIPILEESGLIIPTGEWVIRETCQAIKRWEEQGLPPMPVSVNVAAPQFNQKDFVQRVKRILDETGIDPKYLEIEITESCLMSDGDANRKILEDLKGIGLAISIDDFGTGYSSLSHLQRFPIDTLKIDRSFITNVNKRNENDNAGIVTAIMALSHSLRLNVVAEGVETAHELAYLHALGCHTIQGFLFSRPLTENDVVDLLHDSQCMDQIMEAVRDELSV